MVELRGRPAVAERSCQRVCRPSRTRGPRRGICRSIRPIPVETPDLVAAGPAIPGLGDQLDVPSTGSWLQAFRKPDWLSKPFGSRARMVPRSKRKPSKGRVEDRIRNARDSLPGMRDALSNGALGGVPTDPQGDENREPPAGAPTSPPR